MSTPQAPCTAATASRAGAAALAIACAACAPADAPGDDRSRAPVGSGAEAAGPAVAMDLAAPPEAVSLLGDRLYPLVLDPETRARLEAQLDSALDAYEADPGTPETLIWVGRRYGYLGRYRDAIDAFTEGIGRHPEDARFYRHRGHRYISVREFDRAVVDLEHAVRLTSGRPDRVEPDGMPNEAGVPRSTLQTNIWYHLGLARYLAHDFQGAVHAYRRGYELSPNDDMRVAMADWLWLGLERLGRAGDAAALLDGIHPDMEILENDAYLHRLMVYKGELAPDSLTGGGLGDAAPLTVATHGYGLGAWYLIRGDEVRARDAFGDVLATGYWPAFGYIAAEAEIHGMPELGAAAPASSSRAMKPVEEQPVDGM